MKNYFLKTSHHLKPALKNYNFKWAAMCLVMGNLAFSPVSIKSVHAQDADGEQPLSLEDYMQNNEPAQAGLNSAQSAQQESGVPATSVFDRLQNAIESVTVADEEIKNEDDALPQVKTERTLKLKGFGTNNPDSDIEVGFGNQMADQSQVELEEEIRREAFDAAITGLFPMRPDQIRELLKVYDTTKRAVEKPINGIPTPRINVTTIGLDPGVTPMILKTAVGHVSTLNILDITGAPWPIQDITWAGDFEVTEPAEGGHIIRVVPLKKEAYGNMSISLLTLKTPISIMLKTSIDEVQYRVDARIPEYGPFAQAPLIQGGVDRVAGNSLIMSLLDGVPPNAAERLKVSGVDGRTSAYKVNGMTYVRTPLALLSPGWEQSVSSADGMNVYALNETPILLLSDQGRFMRASLNAEKDIFDE